MSRMNPESPIVETALAHETVDVSTDAPTDAPTDDASDAARLRTRKRGFIALGVAVALAGGGVGVYEAVFAARYVETDDAYTAAETAQVTPAVAGIVREVRVADTDAVRRGDVLVVLDDVDARLALAQAEADLGRAIRRVQGYQANDEAYAAQVSARGSDEKHAAAALAAAQSDLERARIDLERREALADTGTVSGDELTRARNAFESARANLTAAQSGVEQAHANRDAALGARAANAVLIAGASEQDNPEVALARARRDQAAVNLERTVVRAPVDGTVVKRSVQVGQQVQAGAALLSVVPLAQVHVDANFKEVQLRRIRRGQPVDLVADMYGRHVTYRGTVEGFSGGTGAAFATIPAQNATGNWIKVVQRVPVRIALDAHDLAAHPLQVGLSMQATVDTSAAAGELATRTE
jgi:membrane fusion protein (multidrug efflux system)